MIPGKSIRQHRTEALPVFKESTESTSGACIFAEYSSALFRRAIRPILANLKRMQIAPPFAAAV